MLCLDRDTIFGLGESVSIDAISGLSSSQFNERNKKYWEWQSRELVHVNVKPMLRMLLMVNRWDEKRNSWDQSMGTSHSVMHGNIFIFQIMKNDCVFFLQPSVLFIHFFRDLFS